MIRGCIRCKIEIHVRNLQTKYCLICGPIIQKEKSNDWLRENRRRDFDLFCLQCNCSISNAIGGRKYCNICADIRVKSKRCQSMKNQKLRVKLNKFYVNLRFNFIQSPYFVERKSLNKITLLENK
jgi:hypothetical protein